MKPFLPYIRFLIVVTLFVLGVWIFEVGNVQAGCLGQVHCQMFSNNGTPNNPGDDWCDSSSFDNTGCGAATTSYACTNSYDFSTECADVRCYVNDTCYWDSGGGTGAVCGNGTVESGEACDNGSNNGACPKTCSSSCTTNTCSTCGNPSTCDAGETCSSCPSDCGTCTSYWRVSGEIRNATNGLQSGVTVTVKWPDNSTQTYSSKSTPASDLGVYVVTKNAANVSSSGYFEATAGDAYRVNNTTNAVNKGCSLINNDKTYRCPMNIGFNQPNPPPKWLHFKAYVAPTATPTPTLAPPTCSKNSWPTSITAAGSGTFNVTGNDPDSVAGATTPSVEYYFTKQLNNYCISSPSTGNAVDGKWQKLGTTDSGDLSGSRTLNNATLNLPAGTYMMTANLRDNDNQFSTGNPGTPAGCGYSPNNCNGTFTIGTSNQAPTGTFTTAPAAETTNIAYNGNVTFQARCTDAEGKVTKARIMRTERPLSGGSWPASWITGSSERTSASGTSPLDSGSVTLTCNNGMENKSHRFMVECEDLATLKCSGDPAKSWNDCGSNDYKVINCAAAPSTPTCSLSMSGLSLNPNGTGTMTANVTAESGGTVNRIDFSSSSTARVTVNPASDTTRSTNSFSTTVTAAGSAGQTATITARGFINGTERCSTTANVTIVSTPVCTGGTTPPASNYTVCSGDNTGLSSNTAWARVNGSSACSSPSGSAPKCQWYCNSGTTWNGSICEADDPVTCSISPSSTVLNMGGAVTLNLSTSGLGTNPTSTWTKDNARIATLTGSGSSRVATACSSCNTGSTILDSGVTVAVSGAGKTCNATADIDVAPASSQPCTVSLSPTSATIDAGQTRSFTGTTNAPSGSTYQWIAETPSVLSYVSHTGLNATFMGVSAGPSALRVRLRVNPPASSNLTTCEATANVRVNSTVTTVGCNEVCNGSTTVCQSGLVCADLGATDRCRNAACSSVTSCNCPPGTPGCDMTLTPNTWSPAVGATRNYTASVSNVTNGTLNSVSFSTANSGVVNISGSCNSASCTKQATAVASGTTTITATARVANTDGVCSASKTITVAGAPPPSDLACNQTCTQNSECESGYCHTLNSGAKVCRNSACTSRSNCTCIDPCTLTLDPTSLNLNVGETKVIAGTITNQPSNATIRWSLDEAVANIGLNPGLNPQLTGEVGGSATLTGQIRVGNTTYCSATASINVNDNPTQVGCNQVCNGSSIVCANGNHTCYDHDGNGTTTCRRAACDWDNNCDCQPTVVNACNGNCQGDLGDTGVARVCGSGMTCVSGQCRDAGCPTNASCVCQPPVCHLTTTFSPTDRELFDYTGAAIPGYPRQGTLSTEVEVSDGYLDEIEYSTSQAGVVAIANPQSQTFSDPGTQDESRTLTKNVSAVDLGTTTLQVEGWATGPGGTHLACEETPTVNVEVLPPPCPEPGGLILSDDTTCALNTRIINADWNDVAGATKYQIQYDRTDPDATPRSFTINNPISEFSSSSISSPELGLGEFRVRARVAEGDGVTCAVYPDDPRWSGWQTAASGKTTVNVRVYENNNWVCGNETQLQDEGLASGFGSDYGVNYSGSGFNVNGNADEEFTAQVWLCGGDKVMTLDNPDDPWWFPCPDDTTPFDTQQTMDTSDGGVTYSDVVTSASNTAKPWFQVEGGDAHSKGAISVLLPPYADSSLRFANRLDDVSDSAGMVSAEGGVSVSGNKVRRDKNWRVESKFDDTYRKEDYAYFWRLWQMPQTGAQDDGLAGETKSPDQLINTTTQNLQLSETTKVLFANGNLNVSAGSFGTNSVVVFVKDNLTISGDVEVAEGGYVAFIVDGNISIEPSVELVEGVFIADGTIVVQTNTPDPVLVGSDVQFVGEGIFVGWAGVGLNRDLGEDTDGGGPDQGNNDMPAEKFVYRPDLVLNAPEEFLTTQVRMEERAPRDLFVEGYVTPPPPPETEEKSCVIAFDQMNLTIKKNKTKTVKAQISSQIGGTVNKVKYINTDSSDPVKNISTNKSSPFKQLITALNKTGTGEVKVQGMMSGEVACEALLNITVVN